MKQCARKVLDIADIVRDGDLTSTTAPGIPFTHERRKEHDRRCSPIVNQHVTGRAGARSSPAVDFRDNLTS